MGKDRESTGKVIFGGNDLKVLLGKGILKDLLYFGLWTCSVRYFPQCGRTIWDRSHRSPGRVDPCYRNKEWRTDGERG